MDVELIRSLYTRPPAGFVEARTALTKALKAVDDKESAAGVAKLRRPKAAEYALNRAADDDPELAARWARAVATTEAAQATAIGTSDAAGLRDALAELRSATAALQAAALEVLGGDGGAQREAIADLVRSLTHRAGAAQVLAGVVGSEQIVPEEIFAGATAPARPSPAGERSSRSARETDKTAAPVNAKAQAAALAKERARMRSEAHQAVADAQRRVSAAEAAVKAARRQLDDATRELDAAQRAASAASDTLEHLPR